MLSIVTDVLTHLAPAFHLQSVQYPFTIDDFRFVHLQPSLSFLHHYYVAPSENAFGQD